jgi:hypothetical protein
MKARTFFLIACALPLIAACENSDKAVARFKERQRKYDPPALWSIEVIAPQKAGPVKICADTFVREGFTRFLPNEDGKQCALLQPPTITPGLIRMDCTLNDRTYVIQSRITGDPASAFDVDYEIAAEGASVRQVRRYRRIGACPAGWEIGDNTDQQGNLRRNAMH